MTNSSYKNEQLKREFFEHLKGAEGFAKDSVNKFAEAIGQWQLFTNNDDFGNFNKTKAGEFRDWLGTRVAKTPSGRLSLTSQYNYLRRLQRFFRWVAERPEYRNKVLKTEVEFLRLSKKDARIARTGTTRQMPTLEEAQKVIESIDPKTEIDLRDRAMISLAVITGCRIDATISLKMKSFDKGEKVIYQNPGDGVRTKYSKTIKTAFFPIGWDDPERYFMEWYEYLEKKGFQPDDPIFPATLTGPGSAGYSKEHVGKAFWSSANSARQIFRKRCLAAGIKYFHPHSFRHLVVSIMSTIPLTEEQKRAISMNLGHEDVATTFGSYGYGSITHDKALELVKKLKYAQNTGTDGLILTKEERLILQRILERI